jgi:hypothetical protein
MVALPVDVLVTVGTPITLAARRATETIPIVFAPARDPVAVALVASLSRPGGNVTGISQGAMRTTTPTVQRSSTGCESLATSKVRLSPSSGDFLPIGQEPSSRT